MSRYPLIKGHRPWPETTSAEVRQRETAPTQEVAYTCERGCKFTLILAAGAEIPDKWEHSCGKPARRDGAPEGAGRKVRLPSPGTGKYERPDSDTTPMGQLRKRRTRKQGEAILAEALERARQTGVAR